MVGFISFSRRLALMGAPLALIASVFAPLPAMAQPISPVPTKPVAQQPSSPPAAPIAAPPAVSLSEAEIAGRAGPSVVLIDTPTGRGSGVKVAQGIVTNEHVVGGATSIEVVRHDGSKAPATAVKCDPRSDLALLKTDLDLPSLDLAPARSHRQGDPVLVMGYPLSTRLQGSSTLTRGLISAMRTDERGMTEIQTDAAINGGNSGGAMLNMSGRLIGIPYYRFANAQGISFAVSSESVQGLLDSAGLPCPTVSAPGTLLLADDFSDRANGFMPLISPVPSAYNLGYVEGEYAMTQTNPLYPDPVYAYVPGAYLNSTLGVDARLVGEVDDRVLLLGCRDTEYAGETGYIAVFDPGTGEVGLGKLGLTGISSMGDISQSAVFQTGDIPNRFELTCAGDRISASINGFEVAAANDRSYSDGGMWMGAVARGYENVEARFGNLSVTQR